MEDMLTHKGTVTLHTPRLTLRRFTPQDAQQMYDNWASDERVTRYLTWPPHDSPESTRALLEIWCAQYDKPEYYQWVIEADGQAVGSISVVEHNARSGWAELGYCLGHAFWGKGLMTEAVRAVCAYLFEEVGFHRLHIEHAVKNPASGAVARKCGFTLEGTRRECFLSLSGEYLDISGYGMLRSEWRG